MTQSKIRFAAIGECMIELSHLKPNELQLGFAGDTFNVCVYFARCSDLSKVEVEFISALGADPYSEQMREFWSNERVGSRLTSTIEKKLPGLYFIRTDNQGERRFYYYRSDSAAKKMFVGSNGDIICEQLAKFDYIYFSGISLAILDDTSRDKFFHALENAKNNGAIICFDSNYRPILWESVETAKRVMSQFLPLVTIALPSYDDEFQLYADQSMEACARRIQQFGVKEVVVKRGEEGCFIFTSELNKKIPVCKVSKIVDTTAAGDSFNGAYLAFRAAGMAVEEAIQRAMTVSGTVIQYPGAILPKHVRLFEDD